MASAIPVHPARIEVSHEGETMVLRVEGDWRIAEEHPTWENTMTGARPQRVRVEAGGVGGWDSSLALFISGARRWSARHGVELAERGVPVEAGRLADLLAAKAHPTEAHARVPDLVTGVGLTTVKLWAETKELAQLVGECVYSVGRFVRGQAQFRWRDSFSEMQQCGAMALPIVGLISFLVGVTLAYTGSIVVRQYGGDIWIADMVGLAVVREMGPVMAAVVLAGRTGAAFAATLGNMKANEEIDALETLGVSPVDFLVMPRISALFWMMPFLTLYSDGLGVLGGMAVAAARPLNIPPNLFWAEMQTIVDLSDISTGLIKGAAFGLLIGLAGCWRGLQADRSAVGVGQAATAAVVTSVLLMTVADAVFAVIFNILGW
ncbi:MAG TPA: ABC transporter permease [Lacunisphaera sp.]|jgi:phospholipid/cholesterol/gamma-HCH transport system permease protein|nr:ABC transporter permease [Lacunisphaera sp.]